MSKSILVIGTPDVCSQCKFSGSDGEYLLCKGKFDADGNKISEEEYLNRKPDWCPLKEIPKKKEPRKIYDNNLGHFRVSAFDKGYNKCIDEILQ